MQIREAKCIDDHFLCLIRLVVMSVLKSEERGEYIHINRFELIGHFFQGHRNASICYAMNILSECRIVDISLNDEMIYPCDAPILACRTPSP